MSWGGHMTPLSSRRSYWANWTVLLREKSAAVSYARWRLSWKLLSLYRFLYRYRIWLRFSLCIVCNFISVACSVVYSMDRRWLYKTVFQDFFHGRLGEGSSGVQSKCWQETWEKAAVSCSASVSRKLGRRQQWRAVQVLAGNLGEGSSGVPCKC